MPLVTSDRRDGATISETSDGYASERVFVVSGLTGDACARLYAAMQLPAIPAYGSPHPSIPGIVCLERRGDALGIGQAKITCVYRKPKPNRGETPANTPPITNTSSAGLQEIETNFDVYKKPILVDYTYPDGKKGKTQLATVRTRIPRCIVRQQAREIGGTAKDRRALVGKVDGDYLCTNVETVSTDGVTFDCVYEFEYSPQGWKIDVSYIDPETKEPPADISKETGNGVVTVDIFEKGFFANLGIG